MIKRPFPAKAVLRRSAGMAADGAAQAGVEAGAGAEAVGAGVAPVGMAVAGAGVEAGAADGVGPLALALLASDTD